MEGNGVVGVLKKRFSHKSHLSDGAPRRIKRSAEQEKNGIRPFCSGQHELNALAFSSRRPKGAGLPWWCAPCLKVRQLQDNGFFSSAE